MQKSKFSTQISNGSTKIRFRTKRESQRRGENIVESLDNISKVEDFWTKMKESLNEVMEENILKKENWYS